MERTYGRHILKRWSNDFGLPIKVFKEPYFSYFLDLYDEAFESKSKLKILDDALEKFKNEEEFLTYNNTVIDNIVAHISNKEEYKEFINMNMDKYSMGGAYPYPKSDIYKKQNTGKFFVSIDLVKANFQTLKYINPSIVDDSESYDEFILNFSDLDYIKDSKCIRQVIFGKLNPKRQLKVARFLIERIIEYIITMGLTECNQVAMASHDEFIFEIEESEVQKFIDLECKLKKGIKGILDLDVDIEIFKLNSIEDKYFIREFLNKEGYAFSCVPAMYFAQVFKKYNNMDIETNDLVFVHENKLAMFLEHEV